LSAWRRPDRSQDKRRALCSSSGGRCRRHGLSFGWLLRLLGPSADSGGVVGDEGEGRESRRCVPRLRVSFWLLYSARGGINDVRVANLLLVQLILGPDEHLEAGGELRLGRVRVLLLQNGLVHLAGNLLSMS